MMMPIVADKVKDSKRTVKQECILVEDDRGNVGDWIKKKSSSGRWYYVNNKERVSQWECPSGLVDTADHANE